jgi:hypothetical protein
MRLDDVHIFFADQAGGQQSPQERLAHLAAAHQP